MNYYDYGYSYGTDLVSGILAVYFIVLMVLLIFYVISYVFKGIGMYTIAKRQGMEYPWLAFIPFARYYLHGELAGRIALKRKEIKNPGIWLLVTPFIIGVIDFIFFLIFWMLGMGTIISIVSSIANSPYGYGSASAASIGTGVIMGFIVIAVLWVIVVVLCQAVYKVLGVLINQQIFSRFTSRNMSVAHAAFCTLIPLYESFCLFAMRNKAFNQGMEPDSGRPFTQAPPVIPPSGGPTPGTYNAAGTEVPPRGAWSHVPPMPPQGAQAPVSPVPPQGAQAPVHPVPPQGEHAPVSPVPAQGEQAPVHPVPPQGEQAPVSPLPAQGEQAPVHPVPPQGREQVPPAAPGDAQASVPPVSPIQDADLERPPVEPMEEPKRAEDNVIYVSPSVGPAAEPAVKPDEEPVAEPAAKPDEEPVAEPAAKPDEEPVAEPAAKPDEEPSADR